MRIGTSVPISRISEYFSEAEIVEVPAREINKLDARAFGDLKTAVDEGRLKTFSCNCLTPNEMRLTGPEVDMSALREYIKVLFDKLAQLKISMIVFGAGKSKAVPEGFSREKAWDQLFELGECFAREAAQYGQIIAVEPLSYTETNIINTVAEAAQYSKVVNRDNFKCLVDFYHFHNNGEKLSELSAFAKELVHAHIAAPVTRTVPQNEENWAFFRSCIQTLDDMGYEGGLCFEGKMPGNEEVESMLRTMKAMRA